MKKNLGQNFLRNDFVINQIINAADINEKSHILEVGPGDGALTKEIIKKNPKKFIAIELDKDLKKNLKNFFLHNDYKLIFQNALKFKEQNFFNQKITIISNLPYNNSVELLVKWIYLEYKISFINKMILMFQKEVGERILSCENSKKYGRITLFANSAFSISKISEVDKTNFFPIPKVDSIILKFVSLDKKAINEKELLNLEIITKKFFANRRKKLKHKIKDLFSKDTINKYNLEKYFDLRAEQLNKENFFFLSRIFSN